MKKYIDLKTYTKMVKENLKNAYVIKPGDKVIYEEIYNDKTKKFRRIK